MYILSMFLSLSGRHFFPPTLSFPPGFFLLCPRSFPFLYSSGYAPGLFVYVFLHLVGIIVPQCILYVHHAYSITYHSCILRCYPGVPGWVGWM